METRELRITKSVTFIKGELHTTEPKAKSPIRVIVPPGSLLEILKNYKATVKVDHQIGKTDAPMPSDEQKQHTDQSGFQPYKSKYRKAGTGGIYQLNDPNTHSETPTVSVSPALSTPKPVKNAKKKWQP